MTDNPFEDLPEWKERRRLQELQAQQHVQADGYPVPAQSEYSQPLDPQPAGYAQNQQTLPPEQSPQHGANEQHAPVAGEPYYQQPYGQPGVAGYASHPPEGTEYATLSIEDQLAANLAQSDVHGYGVQEAYSLQPQPGPLPTNDQLRPPAYPGNGEPAYANQIPLQPNSEVTQPPPDYQPVPEHADFTLGEAQHDPLAYQSVQTPDGAPSRYDSYHYAGSETGLQTGSIGVHGGPATEYGDQFAADAGQWSGGATGVAPDSRGMTQPSELQAADPRYDEAYGDEDYYDDENSGFSWKLAAAVIVTGAVVTGGGVVLYDSFKSGARNGPAPIVKAERAPAKTAPKNAGGKQFAHRDSKLLGRLDSSGESRSTRRIGNGDANNRVRSVPTVRIDRNGNLVPSEPREVVSAPETPTATPGSDQTPGIKVVQSLNGSGNRGLGSIVPPVLPKAEPRDEPRVSTPTKTGAIAQDIKQPTETANARAPTIKNRPSGNLATRRGTEPPPVPSRSAVGTAWRSTAPKSSATRQQPQLRSTQTTRLARANPSAQTPVAQQPTQQVERAAPTSGSRKYVAVLATEATRMKALKSFAELQQKHPNALQNRIPDVQRADLKSRGLGIMYRVVVGPAGPRSAANSVCSSLKSEGYKGCWVKPN